MAQRGRHVRKGCEARERRRKGATERQAKHDKAAAGKTRGEVSAQEMARFEATK